MNLQLLSCDAQRPNRRAIIRTFEEIGVGIDSSLARELMENLLDGSPVEIEIASNPSSAFRALRKLNIDYEIEE